MSTLTTFARKFAHDQSMVLVRTLTHHLLTTIVPILLALLSAATYVLGALSPHLLRAVLGALRGAVPRGVGRSIHLGSLEHGVIHLTGPLALVSLAALLWAGCKLFAGMEHVFVVCFQTERRSFVRQKVMAVGMIGSLALLLPLSAAVSSLVTAGSTAFRALVPPPLGILLAVAGPLSAFAVLWVLFLLLYTVVPNTRVPFRHAGRGALVAALLFALFDVLFPLSFQVFMQAAGMLGAAVGTPLVLAAWLWCFALATVIGAQWSAVTMGIHPLHTKEGRSQPQEHRGATAY